MYVYVWNRSWWGCMDQKPASICFAVSSVLWTWHLMGGVMARTGSSSKCYVRRPMHSSPSPTLSQFSAMALRNKRTRWANSVHNGARVLRKYCACSFPYWLSVWPLASSILALLVSVSLCCRVYKLQYSCCPSWLRYSSWEEFKRSGYYQSALMYGMLYV